MLFKSAGRLLASLSIGILLVGVGPVATFAKQQIIIIIVFKAGDKKPIDQVIANADGEFSVRGLDAGSYKFCLENGTGCAKADVGEAGSVRGVAKLEDTAPAGKKHNYVGHVTLLR